MKYIFAFFAFCIVSIQSFSLPGGIEASLEEWDFEESAKELADSQWEEFKLTHKKQYKDQTEELYRKKIFIDRSTKIAERNLLYAKGLAYTPAKTNYYSDFLHSEIKCLHFPANRTQKVATFIPPAHVTLPDHVDWREKKAVTPVKHQGNCGSCYAFSANGALEGQHFRKTEKLVPLSEQQIIDCSQGFGNHGCNGGFPATTFTYVTLQGGVDTLDSYPYTMKEGECAFNSETVGATDRGFMEVERGSEEHLKAAVAAIGPISVGIDADDLLTEFRGDMVYQDDNCSSDPEKMNHAVLVVGYGTDPNDPHPDYWIIKNSWGNSWGNGGFAKFARNKNLCGIGNYGSYPLV